MYCDFFIDKKAPVYMYVYILHAVGRLEYIVSGVSVVAWIGVDWRGV